MGTMRVFINVIGAPMLDALELHTQAVLPGSDVMGEGARLNRSPRGGRYYMYTLGLDFQRYSPERYDA